MFFFFLFSSFVCDCVRIGVCIMWPAAVVFLSQLCKLLCVFVLQGSDTVLKKKEKTFVLWLLKDVSGLIAEFTTTTKSKSKSKSTTRKEEEEEEEEENKEILS